MDSLKECKNKVVSQTNSVIHRTPFINQSLTFETAQTVKNERKTQTKKKKKAKRNFDSL